MNGTASSPRAGVPPLRIAIAGCGRMGRLHSERIRADGRSRVVAVFDIDSACAAALKESLAPEAVLCPQFEDLVSLPGIDATIICTPTQLHFEQATAFLERKIPVLCEKPLARTRT